MAGKGQNVGKTPRPWIRHRCRIELSQEPSPIYNSATTIVCGSVFITSFLATCLVERCLRIRDTIQQDAMKRRRIASPPVVPMKTRVCVVGGTHSLLYGGTYNEPEEMRRKKKYFFIFRTLLNST